MYPAGDEEDITLQFALLRSSKVSASPLLTFFASSCPFQMVLRSSAHGREVTCWSVGSVALPSFQSLACRNSCSVRHGLLSGLHRRHRRKAHTFRLNQTDIRRSAEKASPTARHSWYLLLITTSPIYPSLASSVFNISFNGSVAVTISFRFSGRKQVYVQFVNLLVFRPQPSVPQTLFPAAPEA